MKNTQIKTLLAVSLFLLFTLFPSNALGGTVAEGAECTSTNDCVTGLICGAPNPTTGKLKCVNPNPNETLKKDLGTLATKEGIQSVLEAIVNWVFAVMVVVGTVFVVLAAFQFVTEGGDPAKVAEARMKLIWAVLGFAVAVLARAILPLVKSLLGLT